MKTYLRLILQANLRDTVQQIVKQEIKDALTVHQANMASLLAPVDQHAMLRSGAATPIPIGALGLISNQGWTKVFSCTGPCGPVKVFFTGPIQLFTGPPLKQTKPAKINKTCFYSVFLGYIS
jgi:hypothetical protein